MKGLRSTALLVLAAVAGGLILALWLSSSSFRVAGTTVEAKIFPSKQGITLVSVPPLGRIKANTHKFPVGIGVSITKVSIEQMRRLASPTFSQEDLINQVEVELPVAARRFVTRLLFLAALGGLAAGLILPGRNWKRMLAAASIGLLAVAVPALIVKQSYNLRAWRQPKYTGMLATAPWLLGTLEEKLNDLDAFRAELRNLAKNLHEFYSKIDGLEPVKLGNGTIKVLHVGDIHNNPAAIDLIAQVAKDFHVDMVVDTGDLTDFGTPIEAGFVSRVSSLTVPYVFVPGNHDSESVITALRSLPNVRVIENKNEFIRVKGIRIFGVADPSAYEFSAEPATGKNLAEFSDEVSAGYERLKREPDIVAIHSIEQAKELIGKAPLILTGHTHQPSLRIDKGTLVDDVGTTGASGLRNFKVKEDLPYSLKLLYFSERSKKLMAIDSLTFSGVSRDFMLERRLISEKKDELKNTSRYVSLNLSRRAAKN